MDKEWEGFSTASTLVHFKCGFDFSVSGMAGAIHFLSDILTPENSRFPAFELGPSRMDEKEEQSS